MAERTAARLPATHVLIPGDWHTPTGGFVYDRRLVQALREAGGPVAVCRLDGAWPHPDAAARAAARERIAALPDGACVLADGLAFGVLADEVAPHARRLCWVALVHHPLHLEAGLPPAQAARLREAERAALRHARHVVVTSPRTVDDVCALGVPRERVSVVAPGSDPPAPTVRAPRAAAGDVQLLCVATLTPRKGHRVLLQALRGLTHLPWTLHAVGSPDRAPVLARHLHASTARGPLAGRVVWHGEVDAAALQARYAAADVFVLASLHEGHGMVIDEALRHGLPVLASRAGALVDTVPRRAGVLVPVGDVGAWRAALGRMLQDDAHRRRLARGARTAGQALPGWAQQAARMARVLQRAHRQPPPAPEGFSPGWLALREPFDTAARDRAAPRLGLPGRLASARGDAPVWRVMDLGCGTGANLRWLAPRLGGAQQWLVVDRDPALLARWARQPGMQRAPGGRLRWAGAGFDAQIVRRQTDLARDLEALPWSAVQLVTASAWLDLVGDGWIERLAVLAAQHRVALLFTLSVDGRHAWQPRERDDARVHRLFAAHQRRDKGLGPALGAQAVPRLVGLLRARGFAVQVARSDWSVAPPHPNAAALWCAMVDGMGRAAIEQDPQAADAVTAWQSRRRAQAGQGQLQVGHLDLLALPPRRAT